jgi:hypothetical protein
MPFPTTAFGVVAVVTLLVPGLVYELVRRGLRGFRFDDLTIDARVAQALVVSVVLDAVYLIAVGSHVQEVVSFGGDNVVVEHPATLGVAVLIGALGVPAMLASVRYSPYRLRSRPSTSAESNARRRLHATALEKLPLHLERKVFYTGVPTAWDWGATNPAQRMVRVRLPDGRYVGGLFGPGSYVSTYPEPRDLYLSHQYHFKEDGSFGAPALKAAGLWLRISDDHIVEFFLPSYTDDELQELQDD